MKFNWQCYSEVVVLIHIAYINILHCVLLLQRRKLRNIQSFKKQILQQI